MNAIEVAHVSKVYRRYTRRRQFATLKSALLSRSLIADLRPDETFPAVQDVTFSVARGRTCGIIGRNGSGKSTILKLVAGITKPTAGTVTVDGRISALIELGAGFHPEISGRENVFINGIMLGLSKREVARRFDEIVEFAELEDFIDAPVKTYSSGMYMRLGFAVAIHVDPDVLLVDEVMAVGDEGFTHKCLDKFAEFRRRDRTILLVTHSLGFVERFCDEALWLDGGAVRASGDPKRVVGAYLTKVEEREEELLATTTARAIAAASGGVVVGAAEDSRRSVSSTAREAATIAEDGLHAAPAGEGPQPASVTTAGDGPQSIRADAGPDAPGDASPAVEGRWGSREVEITDVALLDREGQPSFVFHSGDPVAVRLEVRAHQPTDDLVFGIGLFNVDGVCCYGTNTYLEEMSPAQLSGAADVTFIIDGLDFVEGTYKLDVAVHKCDGYPYDYHRLLYTFRIKSRTRDVGVYRPRHRWAFSPNVRFTPRGDTQT